MTGFEEAAKAYARRGWAVLPLTRRNKIPAIKGGCKSAVDDVRQARAWWAQNPDHNVGIAPGSPSRGLVVIDLDVDEGKGEDGYETLRLWEREHGELPETVTAITGRGGIHMYYSCNTPIGCSVNADLGGRHTGRRRVRRCPTFRASERQRVRLGEPSRRLCGGRGG